MAGLDTHSISFYGSKYNWSEVDEHARIKGFKERSKYIQWLVEKDIEHKKAIQEYFTIEIILLLLLSIIMVLLILVYNKI